MRSWLKTIRRKDRKLLDEIKALPCIACGMGPCDPAHLKSKGSGGDDTWENVIPLCRKCHHYQHLIGLCKFIRTNNDVYAAVRERGWDLVYEGERWKLIRSEGAV